MPSSSDAKKVVFVIGGARSGKSSFALRLAENIPGPKAYIATAEARDAEMDERIRNHKKERDALWETIEETVNVGPEVLGRPGYGVILVDCVTIWLTNLIEAGLKDGDILTEVKRLSAACRQTDASVIAVSNEVGLGIVPENALARRFRDLSGQANRLLAEEADEVFFIAAGMNLKMK